MGLETYEGTLPILISCARSCPERLLRIVSFLLPVGEGLTDAVIAAVILVVKKAEVYGYEAKD